MGQWRALVELPVNVRTPAHARRVVRAMLTAWELDAHADDAQLVVSELITNVLQHAPSADSLELEVSSTAESLRIGLADGSSIKPVVRELTDDQPSGRGMAIVEALASRWGVEERAGGKRVWVELDLADDQWVGPSA
ncbi:MAG: ATP-binding protein [Jatrophihabitans sp.]|uniref:ATP-binding protein n=1 Tax=Jatrophihabitans sp. TaxID=1932789 RepID=UPI003F8228A1